MTALRDVSKLQSTSQSTSHQSGDYTHKASCLLQSMRILPNNGLMWGGMDVEHSWYCMQGAVGVEVVYRATVELITVELSKVGNCPHIIGKMLK